MDCRLYLKGLVLCIALTTHQSSYAQDNQRWRDSLTVLNRLIATQPWSSDLHLRKAAANLELQQWQYAIDEYALILQREPHKLLRLYYILQRVMHIHLQP